MYDIEYVTQIEINKFEIQANLILFYSFGGK